MNKFLILLIIIFLAKCLNAQQWLPLGTGVNYQGTSGSIVSVVFADTINDYLYAAGYFDTAGNAYADECARWDGQDWHDMSTPDEAHAQFLIFNGELYHAGEQVEKWNGSSWVMIDPYFNDNVSSLIEYNGQLLAGGQFTSVSGTPVNRLAALDSNDEWQPFVGGGIIGSGFVSASEMISYNGELIVAGGFDDAGGVACNNIAKWDGSQWYPLGSGTAGTNELVRALEIYQGYLYIAGTFDYAGGIFCDGFAKWDGGQWYEVDNTIDLGISSMKSHEQNLFIGGSSLNGPGIKKFDGQYWSAAINNLTGIVHSLTVLNNILYAGCECVFFESSDTFADIGMLDLMTGQWQPVIFSEDVKIYPNPSTEKIYLTGALANAKVSVINSLGQLVLQATHNSNEPIDICELAAGFYSLLLTSEKKRHAVSFIKQ